MCRLVEGALFYGYRKEISFGPNQTLNDEKKKISNLTEKIVLFS